MENKWKFTIIVLISLIILSWIVSSIMIGPTENSTGNVALIKISGPITLQGQSGFINTQSTTDTIDLISKAISHLPQLSNNHVSYFFYYRSILHLYSGDYAKSLSDIDKAI